MLLSSANMLAEMMSGKQSSSVGQTAVLLPPANTSAVRQGKNETSWLAINASASDMA
jgi:hypothetical protein